VRDGIDKRGAHVLVVIIVEHNIACDIVKLLGRKRLQRDGAGRAGSQVFGLVGGDAAEKVSGVTIGA